MKAKELTGRQIAAARALVGMRQSDIATMANISVETLRRMETSEHIAAGMSNNVDAVRRALENCGAVFIGAAVAGYGVRIRYSNAQPAE